MRGAECVTQATPAPGPARRGHTRREEQGHRERRDDRLTTRPTRARSEKSICQNGREVAGLTLPEYGVLVVVHTRNGSGVVALQREINIDKAWISPTLSSLVTKNLVVSEPDPDDARRTVFKATPRGKRAVEALVERAIERQKRILRGFTTEDVKQLMDYLARVQENVDPE